MYKIGEFKFEIEGISGEMMPFNLSKFKKTGIADYHYQIKMADKIVLSDENFTVNKPGILIKIEDELETRYLSLPGDNQFYGRCKEIDKNNTEIQFNQNYQKYLKIDTVFNSLLSLERRMNEHNCYVLHSSYIVYKDEAILFSAPSGTGKSTQADLWKKYRDIRIINGDRTLLTYEEGKFYANGWPICGSSEICHNERYPLKAIVMLDQGPINEIRELSNIEKTKRLIQEITINYHNQGYLDNALSFIDKLIAKIPIINLSCTISEEAVDVLDSFLKEVGPIREKMKAG
ncbi:hypothetical protein [uncultured Thomasclavelia sp.]|uniref:hypothetical protein n=1 Tax=uncultured Thomasclavelia sp. TaxID=3025759 RepID=UPI0025E5A30F|nr:hypothetical protein [uncultured Thomasclavelia sp.]